MLFEPCGDLLKDYGAYCETLRVTEREEVYSAIHTRAVEVPRVAAGEDGREDGATSPRTDAGESRGSATSPKSKSPRKGSRSGAGGRRKSSVKSASDGAAAESLTAAPPLPLMLNVTLTSITLHYPVFCLNQRDMTPLSRAIPHCPSLLSIELVGCGLSVQSYMKLVEAVYRSPRVLTVVVDFNIPFIEHTRQRRFTAGRDVAEAGFVLDPTLHPPVYSVVGTQDFLTGPLLLSVNTAHHTTTNATTHLAALDGHRGSVSSAVSQEQGWNASAATMAPQGSSISGFPANHPGDGPSTAESATGGGGGGPLQAPAGSRSESLAQKSSEAAGGTQLPTSQQPQLVGARLSQISTADAAGAAGLDAAAARGLLGMASGLLSNTVDDDAASAVLYLYPTQYCGLDQQPTPLELQLQEEKEKKGKVDAKKVQQLQAQRDNLRAFDQQHRVPVPRTWDGILFTGIHHLSLRGNHIDDTTATRLAQVLTDHPQSRLVSLNLWGNDITDVGAAALARMLRVNNVLQVLDLGNNQLSDVGLLELVRVFLMQQVTSQEEVYAARRAYLTRRGASEEEQRAAGQPFVLADIPSYEDLYALWWHTQQQQQQQQQQELQMQQASLSPAELSLSPHDAALAAAAAASMSGGGKSPRPPALVPAALPAPPLRDAVSSPTTAGNPKRTPPVKNKASKSESVTPATAAAAATTTAAAAFQATMLSSSAARAANRPTVGFDRDCVRVRHIAENDPTIRIPGNTVLEVLNVEENSRVTVAGAREAARLLRLREPADAVSMLAMVEVREAPGLTSGLSSPPASVSATPDGSAKRSQASSHRAGAAGTAAAALSSPSASANVSTSGLPSSAPTVVHAPELHCAGLRLRVCGVRSHREANRPAWAEMDAVQAELSAALATWTATPRAA